MRKAFCEDWAYIIFMVIIILGGIAIGLFSSYKEMQTFNKFSEQKATFSDALFSELRINVK